MQIVSEVVLAAGVTTAHLQLNEGNAMRFFKLTEVLGQKLQFAFNIETVLGEYIES